jgi:hypothetical protein
MANALGEWYCLRGTVCAGAGLDDSAQVVLLVLPLLGPVDDSHAAAPD